MIRQQNKVKDNILSCYSNMTDLERVIAEFFIKNTEILDFSAKNISGMLHVSEASLSRIAKKCGYKGYREFISFYIMELKGEKEDSTTEKSIDIFTKNVEKYYQDIFTNTFRYIDEEQMRRVASMINLCDKIAVYGVGSSGLVAEEIQLRFMRIGVDINAFSNSHKMLMNAALTKKGSLVIAISLSCKTKEVTDSVRIAKENGATVILITANPNSCIAQYCDEVIVVAHMTDLDLGMKISPQISILIIIDILYSYYCSNDTYFKVQKHTKTLMAINSYRL